MMKVLSANVGYVEEVRSHLKKGGAQNLHILADFDRTLTCGSVNGVKTPSIISMLRDGKHLVDGYAEKAHELFNKYHPIETNASLPQAEKKAAMFEWWRSHNQLLIESGLSKADIEDIVTNGHVQFREGIPEFLDLLHTYNIPIVILSAGVCVEAIQLFFQKINKDYPNILYVTNQFEWDKDGKAIAPKGPIIHVANKDETILETIPSVYTKIKDRKNVLLLGDSVDDVGMAKGFAYDTLLKIGFLNSEYSKDEKPFLDQFDVVLEGDGDIGYINTLVKDIIAS